MNNTNQYDLGRFDSIDFGYENMPVLWESADGNQRFIKYHQGGTHPYITMFIGLENGKWKLKPLNIDNPIELRQMVWQLADKLLEHSQKERN